MRVVVLVAVVVAIGGCFTAPDRAGEVQSADRTSSGGPGSGDGNATLLNFSQSFTISVTDAVAFPVLLVSQNCVYVDSTRGAVVQAGNATLTWTPAQPTASRLQVGARSTTTWTGLSVAGASPLALDLAGVEIPASGGTPFEYLNLNVRAPVGNVAVLQPATLLVEFTYLGFDDVAASIGSCA